MSGGRPDVKLDSVSNPVLLSSENVVTVARSSLRTYANLLSGEMMKWRGPVDGFISTTAGVFDVSLPDFASNRSWNI